MIIEQKSLNVSLDSEKDYDNNIYYFILSALLGGRSIYEKKIKVNDGEQRQLFDNIFKQSSTSSIIPYFVGIAKFLTNVIPLICRSFRLITKWYSVESIESTVAKSVDVSMIWHELYNILFHAFCFFFFSLKSCNFIINIRFNKVFSTSKKKKKKKKIQNRNSWCDLRFSLQKLCLRASTRQRLLFRQHKFKLTTSCQRRKFSKTS